MTRSIVITIAVCAAVALIASWWSGARGYKLGFADGYVPEHVRAVTLQDRIDTQRRCIDGVKSRPRPRLLPGYTDANTAYMIGWYYGAVEACDSAAALASISPADLQSRIAP